GRMPGRARRGKTRRILLRMASRGGSGAAARRQQHAAAFAEADRGLALAAAAGTQDHLVAVLEEGAGLAAGERERLLAAEGALQQAAELAGLGAGQGAGAEQVARLQLAATDAVVGDHLRHG